ISARGSAARRPPRYPTRLRTHAAQRSGWRLFKPLVKALWNTVVTLTQQISVGHSTLRAPRLSTRFRQISTSSARRDQGLTVCVLDARRMSGLDALSITTYAPLRRGIFF